MPGQAMSATEQLRISGVQALITPQGLRDRVPKTRAAADAVRETRNVMRRILKGLDDRLLVVVGSGPLQRPDEMHETAARIGQLKRRHGRDLLFVLNIRAFRLFQPTVAGGVAHRFGTGQGHDLSQQVCSARRRLLGLVETGVPLGVELTDAISPLYLSDLTAWGSIDAAAVESQVHRVLASCLRFPVGFTGMPESVETAIDAMVAARHTHHFLSLAGSDRLAACATGGNADTHLVLRAGAVPDQDGRRLGRAVALLEGARLRPRVLLDFSRAGGAQGSGHQPLPGGGVPGPVAGVVIKTRWRGFNDKLDAKVGSETGLSWHEAEEVFARLAETAARRRGH